MLYRLIKWCTVAAIVVALVLIGAFLYLYQETKLQAQQLIDYAPAISSEILDRNGKRLAYVFKGQHRLYARYDELPGRLIEGVVAMEDTRFFEHEGVNPDAILRAIVKDIKAGHFVEGGSTLTQQLIKNKLLSKKKTLSRKLKEAILALKIEKALSKEQILERYLNEISYGNNYYGVKTAAQGYFHKPLSQLTLKEIALLVGIPNAPSFYNPLKHYDRALNRANNVLYRMKQIGWISQKQYLEAVKETPKVYKSSLTQNIAPYIVDEVLRRFKKRLGDIRTGGYKIYTTVDVDLQHDAEALLRKCYEVLHKRYDKGRKKSTLNGALVAVESATGDILAMVGGYDYKRSQFNRVTMAKRQPGSAFKPFIYQTALDMGYNPATPLTDLRRTFAYSVNGQKRIWAPKNYERNFKGFIPLREALVHSRNLATVNLVADIGVETIRKRLRFLDVEGIPHDMSIALGNLAVTPLKMAQIYTVFANKGHMIAPRLVRKIVSKEGAVIYETRPKEIADFTTPEQAYLMTDILMDVIKCGTGRKAKVEGIELAGKTGTTNHNVDAWFCGYSPEVETIVWFGRDNNKPIGKGATGGVVSAPAFADFYRALLKRYPQSKRHFDIPKGVFHGTYNGKEELYTAISPLPAAQELKQEESGSKIISLDNNSSVEVIKIENDHTSIEDKSQKSDDGGLHPPRKVPQRPVSEDSGTLF